MASYNGADKRLEYLFLNGGGGGGGTTVVANPAGDATDELEKLQVANTIYGVPTSIGAVGLFIDANNVIKASTSIPANTDVSYTATQDCCVRYSLIANANNQSSVKIDGASVFSTYIPSQLPLITLGGAVYLKKGQEIVLRQSYTQANGSYTVYGLLRGSEGGVYLPACYSTEERQVGCWSDGKPLYQRTFALSSPITVITNSWATVDTLSAQIDIKDAEGVLDTNGECTYYAIAASCDSNGAFSIFNYRSVDIQINYVTIRYTKPTDTAGSSIWTPQGNYSVNFSETEHIIGTWIDGSTLYEKTIDFGALPANTQKNVNHGISNFDLIVEIIATATRPASQGTHTTISIPSTHWENISNQNEMSVNDTSIMIRNHNSSFSAWTKTYVTLRYTKASS